MDASLSDELLLLLILRNVGRRNPCVVRLNVLKKLQFYNL